MSRERPPDGGISARRSGEPARPDVRANMGQPHGARPRGPCSGAGRENSHSRQQHQPRLAGRTRHRVCWLLAGPLPHDGGGRRRRRYPCVRSGRPWSPRACSSRRILYVTRCPICASHRSAAIAGPPQPMVILLADCRRGVFSTGHSFPLEAQVSWKRDASVTASSGCPTPSRWM